MWRTIFAQPLSDDDKQAACLSLLRQFIDRMALSTFHRPNPMLQFYSNMLWLEQLVRPDFAGDDFGHKVIWPAFRMVNGWIEMNRLAR